MGRKAALLWDDSHLWGIWTYNALIRGGLFFDILTSSEIRAGDLNGYAALIVPGGWASNKIKSLGQGGADAVREFVKNGGAYIGICGGAGLATSGGLGLAAISRKPTRERVPSLSGPVRLTLNEHPIWEGVSEPVLNIWWPSQFVLDDTSIKVMASFESPTGEAMSSDIPVCDVPEGEWASREEAYGLNLDPMRMSGDPLVVEASYGKGRVLLSLAHFDTPGDANGELALKNLWRMLKLESASPGGEPPISPTQSPHEGCKMYEAAKGIFEFGIDSSLWHRRGPIVQWRRGVRGLEYFTLYELSRCMAWMGACAGPEAEALGREVEDFARSAVELLRLEQEAIGRGERITFVNSAGEEMSALRKKLFSLGKSHGGRFRDIILRLDRFVLAALENRNRTNPSRYTT